MKTYNLKAISVVEKYNTNYKVGLTEEEALRRQKIYGNNIYSEDTKNHQVKVLRDGVVKEINAIDIVIGDILVINKNSYIPADSRVIVSHHVEVDEHVITNKSLPKLKQTNAIYKYIDNLDDMHNMVFAGTYCVNGNGLAVVTSIGSDNVIYQINHPAYKTPFIYSIFKTLKLTLLTTIIIFLFNLALTRNLSLTLITNTISNIPIIFLLSSIFIFIIDILLGHRDKHIKLFYTLS